MTSEEAIKILSKVTLAYEIGKVTITQKEINEALDMAIKALEQTSYKSDARRWKRRYLDLKQRVIKLEEQQLCEDIIRRADVLKYAQLVRDDEGIVHEMVHVDDIKDAPSVTWSGWKSVTEELPEPNTAVLLYVKYKLSRQRTYQLGMWNDNKQTWEDWRTPYDLEEEFEVIAWMELPEIYEEDNHE